MKKNLVACMLAALACAIAWPVEDTHGGLKVD